MDPKEVFGIENRRSSLQQKSRRAFNDAGSISGSISNMSLISMRTVASGTDYAEAYIKAEDQKLYQRSLACLRSSKDNDTDSVVSKTTTVTSEQVDRLASTYEFGKFSQDTLTISSVKEDIIDMINTNPVVIIQGPTGCGKTTQVPQYILENSFINKVGCNIVVTQPRRIAAMSIAKRVCEERNWKLGSLVGYKVGLSSQLSEDTRLTYCTTGVLLCRLIREKSLNSFTHIIIDEVHERDQDMDFLLLVVRKLLRTNSSSVKVILMSATINVDKFAKYFSIYVGKKLTNAPVISVIKSSHFKIREYYLSDLRELGDLPEIIENNPTITLKMLNLCKNLILHFDTIEKTKITDDNKIENRPTVLVFLPGIYEIEEMHRVLIDVKNLEIVVLHSMITNSEQSRIFYNVPKGCRRVILTTNIAESSITVPNVKYVIDFCLTKQLVTDSQTNFQSLELVWASKSNCQQRSGRTGRVMNGRVYRLVPKLFYHTTIQDENTPEILRAPLTRIFIKAKLLDLDKPEALLALALDPPDLTNLFYAVQLLKETGGILIDENDNDPCDGTLTDLGIIMGELPVDINISKLIVLGNCFSILTEAIIMGASMAVKNMFSSQFQKKLSAHNAKLFWSQNSSCDGISFYNAYRIWRHKKSNLQIKTNAEEIAWAKRNFLEVRVLREIDSLVHELTDRLDKLGIKESVGTNKVIWTEDKKYFVLKLITAGAFYPHYYITKPNNDEKENTRCTGGLDPTKTVYLSGWPVLQPGMLYAKRFQDIFSNCKSITNNKIGVKFDHSSRVFIEFSNIQNNYEVNLSNDNKELTSKNIVGDIPMSVYQAIKMRSISDTINIPVMPLSQAHQLADELNIEKKPQTIYLPKENMPVKNSIYIDIRPILPSIDTTTIKIIIKNIINPGFFWACIDDNKIQKLYEEVDFNLKTIDYKTLEKFDDKAPKIGTLVLAQLNTDDNENSYKRALVQNITKNGKNTFLAMLFFIDFGITKSMSIYDIHKLPDDHKLSKIPSIVFQCRLTNIKPLSINNTTSDDWSIESKKELTKLINGNKGINAEIYSVVNSIVSVNLIITTKNDEAININKLFIEKGYGEFNEENFLSKDNHEIRMNNNYLSKSEKFNREEMQYSQLYLADTYVDPPSIEDCTDNVKLRGPYSPLEVKLYGLTNISMGFKIHVHESSVNSVLLDSGIDKNYSRLLVAANEVQSINSNNITLINTTLMPCIPGLCGLISLMFAPTIELRCNSLRTRNTGVLCGLGYDKSTKQSLFPEHDMYVDFDADITINDLQNINKLRYWMSKGIFITNESDCDDKERAEITLKIQNNIHDILLKIFDINRECVPSEIDVKHSQWHRYKSSNFTKVKEREIDSKLIFKFHQALLLDAEDNKRESLLLHLDEIKKIAGLTSADCPTKDFQCKLCDISLYGLAALRSHLYSGEHQIKESKLKKK
ncbi:hypothetical protein HCN44_005070 [Aphidius gifuensis]|uniref:Probable ATP-dependent RNA helicase spindle-E n=1 Tax=Aphidius gifuensis TaxID=684658 RepID=A0A834XTY9_APHGI|nr:probable ATP-dependent RNA helicase spindle-E [Aphidius gifuensis]KAF7992726.1 hypothetical protein HCN44_005070 [Aphidius gifuensis]